MCTSPTRSGEISLSACGVWTVFFAVSARGGIWRDMAGYREIPGDTRGYDVRYGAPTRCVHDNVRESVNRKSDATEAVSGEGGRRPAGSRPLDGCSSCGEPTVS